MSTVLVTGGTGTLGRALVPLLLADGHVVRVLSRRTAPRVPPGATAYAGDIRTGTGLERAADGCDLVIHAASNPRRHVMETEVEGTRNVAAAARSAGAHVVYISIVGVDKHRYFYYRAKRAAEIVLEQSGASWTVLRATQFFDLIEMFLGAPFFVRVKDLRFQPVDVGDVASHLTSLVGNPPPGLAPDFGGPEILSITELADIRREVTGRRARLLPAPAIGFLGDFAAGRHLAPGHHDGTRTWRQWLEAGR